MEPKLLAMQLWVPQGYSEELGSILLPEIKSSFRKRNEAGGLVQEWGCQATTVCGLEG